MNMQYYLKETEDCIADLLQISREVGDNPDFVLAGGGNSSCKIDDSIHVKASGTSLATLTQEELVEMSMSRLENIWNKKYSADPDAREAEVLQDMLEARVNQADIRRPSVETLLHLLFPHRFVVHTHPTQVNGLTCAIRGEEKVRQIFGDCTLWIPVVNPGYLLACTVKRAAEIHRSHTGKFPILILLQNHGMFVAADSLSEIRHIHQRIFEKLDREMAYIPRKETIVPESDYIRTLIRSIQQATGESNCIPFMNRNIAKYITDKTSFHDLSLSVTPDHIVYCGYRPLFVEHPEQIAQDIAHFMQAEGFPPHIIAVAGVAVFASHNSKKRAELSRKLFEDNVKIAVYARSFGGITFMPEDNINFIRHWEVEAHRFSQTA